MKYRIIHPLGWVEFATEPAAIAYRDAHHPGCDVVAVPLDPPPAPE
jgi:hypothetical protein